MKYIFDYSKLKGRIKELYDSQKEFAIRMEMSEQVVSNKLCNKVQFDSSEIKRAIEILKIPDNEVTEYFFTEKVEKTQ